MSNDMLLEVKDLHTHFHTDKGTVRAVDGANFSIRRRETLGLVGESGCGKSVTARSILRLIPSPPGEIVRGEINYHRKTGESVETIDLAKLPAKGPAMRSIRGNEIAMVFQEPMTAFSPVHSIGFQIMETILLHQTVTKEKAREIAVEMLDSVGLPRPEQRVDDYPHQFSGGMRQRAMIAMALSCNPSLLIADEPTTALDVTIQAQILELIKDLQKDFGMAVLYITHDLGVIAETSNHVGVMYLGRVVEYATVEEIFANPCHPYTQALLKSIPTETLDKSVRLQAIEGVVPDPYEIPKGCPFGPRCHMRGSYCRDDQVPGVIEVSEGHFVACSKFG